MKRRLLIFSMFSAVLVGCAREKPQLKVYIVSKDPGPGLHEANFPAFPKFGYIAEKPDLTISQLENVSFGRKAGYPRPDGGRPEPIEDKGSLAVRLNGQDADALQKLTSAHIGARLLLMLNDEPLVAPEIQTPMTGQSMYLNDIPRNLGAQKVKSKLATIVHKTEPTPTIAPRA